MGKKADRKTFIIILVAMLILEGIIVIYSNTTSPYIYEGDKLVAIDGSKVKRGSVPVRVEARNGDIRVSKEISINASKKAGKHNIKKNKKNNNELETLTNYEVSEMLKGIKSEDNLKRKRIDLPGRLSDGTIVSWSKGSASNLYLLPIFLPVMFIYFRKREEEKLKKKLAEEKNSFLCNLPSFNNQLILLLDSGLVLSDALDRIIDGYVLLENPNYFQKRLICMRESSRRKNGNLFSEMKFEASELGIRDFTRIVNILVENQYKGIDVKESLTEAAVVLWSSRRRNAEELGKKAEVKLAFPMALFLIVLIIITALPAMMNAKGGLL